MSQMLYSFFYPPPITIFIRVQICHPAPSIPDQFIGELITVDEDW